MTLCIVRFIFALRYLRYLYFNQSGCRVISILKYKELRSNNAIYSIIFAHLFSSTDSVISKPCVHNLTYKNKKEHKLFIILALKSSTMIKKGFGRESEKKTGQTHYALNFSSINAWQRTVIVFLCKSF